MSQTILEQLNKLLSQFSTGHKAGPSYAFHHQGHNLSTLGKSRSRLTQGPRASFCLSLLIDQFMVCKLFLQIHMQETASMLRSAVHIKDLTNSNTQLKCIDARWVPWAQRSIW